MIYYMTRTFPSKSSPVVQFSMFHGKSGFVWRTLKIITDELNKAKIDHGIIGGIAVYEHGYRKTTDNCDILFNNDVSMKYFHLGL